MKTTALITAMWAVTAAIAVLGVNAGATIWYYMEPAMRSLAEPFSYSDAAYTGLFALTLSVIVNNVVTVRLLRPKSEVRVPR